MMRIALIFFCLTSSFSWSQLDSSFVAFSKAFLDPDFAPIQLNGEWVWYDVANGKASDSVQITDFAQKEMGFYSSYIVKNDSLWGALNLLGEEIQPFAYDSILNYGNHWLTLDEGEWSYHLTSDDADSLINVQFDSLYYFKSGELYVYHQGKTGLILRDGIVILPRYDGIHRFACISNEFGERYYMSLLGEEYNLIDEFGDELLPDGVWDLRCTEDGVFEFRRGNNPEYYIPYSGELVKPNGRDIVFYDEWGYKIYNDDNTRSELHLRDGRSFKDQYDDYFLLQNDYIAVRKDGKVGLTGDGMQLLGEIKYDQINPISDPVQIGDSTNWYFKFYIGDSCGLMDQLGNELFDAQYANILTTEFDDRFIVLDGSMSGVVDRNGRTIIPLKYERLSLEVASKLFIIQHNDKVGLYDYDGSLKAPIKYEGYRRLQTFNDGLNTDALLAVKLSGKVYFANSKGFIDRSGFDHYNFSQDVLKTYSSKAISVFLFDQQGKIEDRSNYPIYKNAIVKRGFHEYWNHIGSWKVSTLEENQKEGYYGLRYYQKRGFGVQPTYRTVRRTIFKDYLGAVNVERKQYDLTNELPLETIGGHHHLKVRSGETNAISYFSTELAALRGGSGDRYMSRTINDDQHHAYGSNSSSDRVDFSDKIHYSDMADFQRYYRRYFKGGEVEVCSIESSDVSFYDYFAYLNAADGCRVSADVMKMILNPKIGVRFKNADWEIINAGVLSSNKGYQSYDSPERFERHYYLNDEVFFEKKLTDRLGTLRLKRLPKKDKEEVKITNVIGAFCPNSRIKRGNGVYVLAKVKKNRLAKIHVDFPNYFFHQDSVDLSYEAGRITRRVDSSTVQLITPKGKILVDSCIMIRYLNEERFGIYRKNGWQLINRNGKLVSDEVYTGVSEFKGDRAEFKLKNGKATVLNSNAEELLPLPEPRVFLDDDHYYFASNSKQLIKRSSDVMDQARDGEKYQKKGFFVSKNDGKTKIRRFGSEKTVELKSTPSLKSFGSCLYYKKGKHFYAIDSNLVIRKFKKTDKFRVVTPEIGWLEGKRDQLIDSDWNYICKMGKKQSFELRDGNLIVLENDSVYRNYGSLKTVDKYPELKLSSPDVKVFYESGKYGVMRGEEIILPLNYSWLSKINDQEFMTRTESENHLYNIGLKRMVNRPFDRYIETAKGNFVFFYKDQVYTLDKGKAVQITQ